MASDYSRSLLRVCVAQLCQNLGWNAIQSTPLELLTDILERYLSLLGQTTHRYCEQFGRLDPNLDDVGLAFRYLGIPLGELEEYVRHVEPVPFAHETVAFPAPKPNNMQFPNPKSREVTLEREEHIPDHLPYMYPGMEDEVEQNKTPTRPTEDVPPFLEERTTPMEVSPVVTGEKRAVSSPGDGLPFKRMRLSSSNLPEEAGHSQYEMTSVTMTKSGHLTPTRGQGKLPDARTPPPGLRQSLYPGDSRSERKKDSEKEREKLKMKDKHKSKSKDVDGSSRTSSPLETELLDGKENVSDSKSDASKSSKKDVVKLMGKHSNTPKSPKSSRSGIKVKSLSKLKNPKKKNFGAARSLQEMLFSDPLNMSGPAESKTGKDSTKFGKVKDKVKVKKRDDQSRHPELARLIMGKTEPRETSKSVTKESGKSTDTESEKEKSLVPVARWDVSLDESSDDSGGNLSGGDSPAPRLIIAETYKPRDTENLKKVRLQRIDDILDSVIKSSVDMQDSVSQDDSVESEPLNLVKAEKSAEKSPIKSPKVKAKDREKEKAKTKESLAFTSSLDLDACIDTVVRQSAEEAEESPTKGRETPKVATSAEKKLKLQKKLKNKTGKGKGLNKVREKLKQKLKSRSFSQDSSELDSETNVKPEKVYPKKFNVFEFPPDSPEEPGPLAPLHPLPAPLAMPSPPLGPPSPQKTVKEPSPLVLPVPQEPTPDAAVIPSELPPLQLKIDLGKEKHRSKDKSKEKEHKKDRKDKKKDKEKKKKNKDKDREKGRDREKKDKEKHREDKNGSFMPLTVPKLKLKIGGVGISSTSVTISKGASPSRETPSPIEVKPPIAIPKLVIKPVPRLPVAETMVKPPASPPPLIMSPPTPPRPPPPPGFKAIPQSPPVARVEPVKTLPSLLLLPPLPPQAAVMSPVQALTKLLAKPEKKSPPSQPIPIMPPKFKPIPPMGASPPAVQREPSPVRLPTPPPPTPSTPPSPEKVKAPSPPPPSPSPSPPPPPPKARSPSPVRVPVEEEMSSPSPPPKPEATSPSPAVDLPLFYPAPPRRKASLSPRSRGMSPSQAESPPKRKTGSPRGRKPGTGSPRGRPPKTYSPARNSLSTPPQPKRKGSTTSPGRKKGSPKAAAKKAAQLAAKNAKVAASSPSSLREDSESPPPFVPPQLPPTSPVKKKEETPSPAPSPSISPSPSPPPTAPQSGSQDSLPPPPPPSKPQPLQRAVFAETVATFVDDSGQRIWICPTCKLPDDGSPMIGCDKCDEWYHW